MIAVTASGTQVQGASSKKAKKKKKSSEEAPRLEMGVEEAAKPLDDATLKAGTTETEEAEQP